MHNWGKYPDIPGDEYAFQQKHLQNSTPWIARGMGRCYGDASLGKQMLSSRKKNRLLDFDETTGIVKAEAGVTYEDLLDVFVPKGWFPPVTPGTKFVSLGGAVASDVHGKNHHSEGSIGRHVKALEMILPSGEHLKCSPIKQPEIFQATLGGMGLTAWIDTVSLQLKPIESAWIDVVTHKTQDLREVMDRFEAAEDVTYTVAWLDTTARGKKLGRSLLMLGEHASLEQLQGTKHASHPLQVPHKRKFSLPFDFPNFVINRLSITAFNTLYYHKELKAESRKLVDYDSYFYPLDSLHHWNRVYGKRGFVQYQFVIPKEQAYQNLQLILQECQKAGLASFLTVLKLFGKQDTGLMSFPMEGYTLAVDFAVSPKLFPVLQQLDEFVADVGGRIYLTKDSRLSPQMFRKMYPQLPDFHAILHQVDPAQQIQSAQSQRLQIHV